MSLMLATDIVEGMVNKGIFLNGDNGGTFLHFGSYQNSCISDPTLCGPEGECPHTTGFMYMSHTTDDWFHFPAGITFSFFWKNHEAESRFAVVSGGKVISNGFSVYTNPFGGYVEFYTRGNNHRWKANIKVPGGWRYFPEGSWWFWGIFLQLVFFEASFVLQCQFNVVPICITWHPQLSWKWHFLKKMFLW